LVSYFGRMLRKDLLYTAVTRASDMLILCGEPTAFERCLTTGTTQRKTRLKDRIVELFWKEDGKPKPVKEKKQTVDSESKTKTESKPKQQTTPVQAEAEEFVLTAVQIKSGDISPMIGMESLTPFGS